jgi:cystathionine beta-lyase/cystathionine gamma-synthase
MTDLEGGADWSAAFTCGMQAVSAVFLAFGAQATVLLNQELYQGIRLLLDAPFGSWGLRAQVVDMTDLGALEVAMARVFADPATARVLLWLETPSNPMLQVERPPTQGRGPISPPHHASP